MGFYVQFNVSRGGELSLTINEVSPEAIAVRDCCTEAQNAISGLSQVLGGRSFRILGKAHQMTVENINQICDAMTEFLQTGMEVKEFHPQKEITENAVLAATLEDMGDSTAIQAIEKDIRPMVLRMYTEAKAAFEQARADLAQTMATTGLRIATKDTQ